MPDPDPLSPDLWCDWCHAVIAVFRMDALVAFDPQKDET